MLIWTAPGTVDISSLQRERVVTAIWAASVLRHLKEPHFEAGKCLWGRGQSTPHYWRDLLHISSGVNRVFARVEVLGRISIIGGILPPGRRSIYCPNG